MKAKVIIENGETTIELKAENDFEKDIIEKVVTSRAKFIHLTSFSTKHQWSQHEEHKITINITETK